MRRRLWVVLVTLAFVAVLFVAVFPSRTFLAQRVSLSRVEEQLGVLDEQNRLLEERAELLRDDAEIERLARLNYNLAKPGEEVYAILPTATPPPPPPPPPAPDEADRSLWNRAWERISSVF